MEEQRLKSTTLNIRTGRIFPWHFQLIAVVIVIGAVAVFITNFIFSMVLLVIGISILTAHSGVLIDPGQKTYRAYNSFIFIKTGSVLPYVGIEKIFLNANKESQKVYTAHTLDSTNFKNTMYDGYLKFVDGTKIHLISDKNKATIMAELNGYADILGIDLHDNTV